VILVHYKIVAALFRIVLVCSIRDVMQNSSELKLYTGFKGYLNADV